MFQLVAGLSVSRYVGAGVAKSPPERRKTERPRPSGAVWPGQNGRGDPATPGDLTRLPATS